MVTTGIIGAGNLGANTAFFLAERNVGPVLVHDIQEGLSTGKTLDIMEMAPLGRYRYPVHGTDSEEKVLESDVLLLAAGSGMTPEKTRETLYEENRELVAGLASRLSGHEGIVVLATEPVDELVTLFVRESGMDSRRVLGLGACLDAARLQYAVSRELGCFAEDVDALVVGRHDLSMIMPADYVRVSGIPVEHLIENNRLQAVFREVREAEDTILGLNNRSAAFYAPASVAADLVEAIVADTGRVLSVSSVLDNRLGVNGAALSLPAMVGAGGIRQIVEPKLTDDQKRAFAESGAAVNRLVG
ncbi:MAG: lactate/malate family dehydrogenase [bacterium]